MSNAYSWMLGSRVRVTDYPGGFSIGYDDDEVEEEDDYTDREEDEEENEEDEQDESVCGEAGR